MYSVEALQKFDRFQAATAATDTSDIDVVLTLGEGSTDPHILRRLRKLVPPSFSMVGRGFRGGWPTGSAEIGLSESAPDEAPASDFDVLDDLRTPTGQMRGQITALRMGGRFTYSERLAHRLDFLLDALEEEGETWGEDSPESLRQMLLLLRTAADLRYPTVTVTPSATFRAQWQADRNSHLAMDFLPDGQVRFVVFSPDPRHSDRVQRVSGIASRAEVMRVVEPYKVRRWAADAGA